MLEENKRDVERGLGVALQYTVRRGPAAALRRGKLYEGKTAPLLARRGV